MERKQYSEAALQFLRIIEELPQIENQIIANLQFVLPLHFDGMVSLLNTSDQKVAAFAERVLAKITGENLFF